MIGARNVNLTMRNIDACVRGSRSLAPYKDRLGRPFEKQPYVVVVISVVVDFTPKS